MENDIFLDDENENRPFGDATYYIYFTTDRTLIRSAEGPKGLAAPPTAHMAKVIFSFPVAVDTLGGYNWRYRGNF